MGWADDVGKCRALSLDGCRDVPFIDSGLLTLNSLRGVTALNLQGCSTLSDAGLAAVCNMHSLATVNLQDCCQLTGAPSQQAPGYPPRNVNSALLACAM